MEWPYYPENHVTSACREAGVNVTELEGGYGGDCLHLCNYEDAEHVYDPDGLDNNTNAYCIDGYDYSEKFVKFSDAFQLDICQSICVPSGEEPYYVSQTVDYHMYMLRDPWSQTEYSSDYDFDSEFWTEDYISQVPYGVDPTNSHEDGIFIVDADLFMEMFEYVYVAHNRDYEGYSGDWYDVEEGEDKSYFYVTVPENDGDLYFSAETYYQGMTPQACTYYE